MKKTLLYTLFLFFLAIALNAQGSGDCDGCQDQQPQGSETYQNTQASKKEVSIFPNPATEFIGLNDADNIKQIMIYNVVGRKMKSFIVNEGEKYYVADLPKGMYLIQMIGQNNKIYTTQRMSKR